MVNIFEHSVKLLILYYGQYIIIFALGSQVQICLSYQILILFEDTYFIRVLCIIFMIVKKERKTHAEVAHNFRNRFTD